MILVFHIPSALRTLTGGAATVEIEGDPEDARDALTALYAVHPALRDRVQDERGDVRKHVHVFIGDESIRYSGGLSTPLSGDRVEISILPAVSGGS